MTIKPTYEDSHGYVFARKGDIYTLEQVQRLFDDVHWAWADYVDERDVEDYEGNLIDVLYFFDEGVYAQIMISPLEDGDLWIVSSAVLL